MCNLNLNPTTCMAVRGVQYWSSSERITKLNELLNKIKKKKKKALKWPNKTRQRQDVGLVTVDTKLTVYIQYDVPFKGQVLPILCTFSNSNFLHWYFLLAWESSMMDTGCLYNTSFTKREKKLKSKCSNFTEITMSKQQPCVPLKASLTSTECPAVWPESQIWV